MDADDQPTSRIIHAPGCRLDSIHWLRHAIAAAGRLVNKANGEDDPFVDAISAGALTDTLGYFAELPGWESITLREIADSATIMPEHEPFKHWCTCGAFGDGNDGAPPAQPLRW